MDLVSVIVPYYNSPLYLLKKCIDALCNQEYTDFEIIVVVDGSKKNYRLVQRCYTEESRVRFVYKEHQGVSAARNLGISLARGTYITFVDSDDYVDKDYLLRLVECSNEADLVICGVTEQFFPSKYGRMPLNLFLSLPQEFNWAQYTNFPVNKLYRKDIIRKYQIQFPEDVSLGEDALFNAKYIQKCQRIALTPAATYHYVPCPTSAINTYKVGYWENEERVITAWWELFHQYALNKDQQNFMYYWLYIKINGALNYYSDHEKNGEILQKMSERILSFPLTRILLTSKEKSRSLMSKHERMKLMFMGLLGKRYAKWNRFVRKYFKK